MSNGFYDILSPEELQAQIALGQMQQMREHAAAGCAGCDGAQSGACAGCPTAAGYASIQSGAPPGLWYPDLMRREPVGPPRARVRVHPSMYTQVRLPPAVRAQQERILGIPTVAEATPGPVDVSYLPLVSAGQIAAAAQLTITQTAQTVFKPHRLNVPVNIANFFLIDAFSVGNVPLSAAAGPVPAASFATDATEANVRKVTANPGVQIVLQVTNIDGAPHRFLSTLFGWSSQPEGCR